MNASPGFDEHCDGIVKWSMHAWAGRGNMIAVMEPDGTIAPGIWQELTCFDPDWVSLLNSVSDGLLKEVDRRLLPLHVSPAREPGALNPNEANPYISGGAPGISVVPTKDIMENFKGRPLLAFKFTRDCPAYIRRFVHRNFGSFDQWFDMPDGKPRFLGNMEELLRKISVEEYTVGDLTSLCSVMVRASGTPPQPGWKPPAPFLMPCELSAVHLLHNHGLRGAFNSVYRIVVGATPADFVFYWRNCLAEGTGVWDMPYSHCLWIPPELARESDFMAALKNWLHRLTGQSSSGSRVVEATSISMPEEELTPLLSPLRTGLAKLPVRCVNAKTITDRWYEREGRYGPRRRLFAHLDAQSAQQMTAVDRSPVLELVPPQAFHSPEACGTWMLEVQIEREVGDGGIRGQDWWLLPRNSGRGVCARMFRSMSRICRNGLFGVQVARSSLWPGPQPPPRIQINLPAAPDVVPMLMRFQDDPLFDEADARHRRLEYSALVTNIAVSDAGRKLRGLIGVFGGFSRARDYWERRFWRELFYQMALRGTGNDRHVLIETEAVLRKELQRHFIVQQPQAAAELCRKVTHRLVNQVAKRFRDAPLTFWKMNDLRLAFENEFKESAKGNDAGQITYISGEQIVCRTGIEPVSEEEFKDGLAELTGLGVFWMGMNPVCPHCHLETWVRTDNLKQKFACPGCGFVFSLVPETPWSYRLNPLIHHCVNHGVLPVWQALEALSHGHNIFFTPSSELLLSPAVNGKTKKEIDVLCVVEGQLVLGEVKTGPLVESDFTEFAAIVLAIRPERAVMFVEMEVMGDKEKSWFSNFKQTCAAGGIDGQLAFLPNY